MKKLFFVWKQLMSTFWFVPVLTIIFAVIMSLVLVFLDNSIAIPHEGFARYFFVNSADSARSILSTISGAMIGVAGTVFSVTLVALTLASSQFGSRLIKNFMYVRLNQIVLGSYVSTYLYCLLVLNAIKNNDGFSFIPSISILVAILAAVVNIILLIVFIHRIAVSIQADHVISDIQDIISKQVQSIFPDKMGDESEAKKNIDPAKEIFGYQNKIILKSNKSGYLQYVDNEAMMNMAIAHDLLFNLQHRPGSFLVKDGSIGILYTKSTIKEDLIKDLLAQFVIGKTKTAQQDLEYSIHQMVEIAARALSPGINDPFTAITCVDNLTATMCYLAKAKFPSKYRFDEEDNLRIIADVMEFEGVLDAAFNQIRQFSKGSTAVMIRLVEALSTIYKFTETKKNKDAVIKHIQMVHELGKANIKEKNDMEDLNQRVEKILNT